MNLKEDDDLPMLLPEPIEGIPEKSSRFPPSKKYRQNVDAFVNALKSDAADVDADVDDDADAEVGAGDADVNSVVDADANADVDVETVDIDANHNGTLLDWGNSTNGFRVESSAEEGRNAAG